MIPLFLVVAGVLAAVVFAARAMMPESRRPDTATLVLVWAMITWLSGVLMITVLASAVFPVPGEQISSVDLVPFRELIEEGPGLGGIAILERLANIVMFLVGGFITSLAMGWRVGRTTVAFLVLGVAIEVVQYIIPGSRVATIDDVLWAVAGGALGALLAMPVLTSSRYQNLRARDHQLAR